MIHRLPWDRNVTKVLINEQSKFLPAHVNGSIFSRIEAFSE